MDDLFSVEFWAIVIFAVAVLIALVLIVREERRYRRKFAQQMQYAHEKEAERQRLWDQGVIRKRRNVMGRGD